MKCNDCGAEAVTWIAGHGFKCEKCAFKVDAQGMK